MSKITEYHVMAALLDAGVDTNDADSFVDGVKTYHGDNPPDWSRELMSEYQEAQKKAADFERAFDILYGPKCAIAQ